MDFVNSKIIKGLWLDEKVGCSFSSSSRASGWLITKWKVDSVEFISSFRGEGFLGIKVFHKGLCSYIVKVYSPCDIHLKRKLSQDIILYKSKFYDGEWCLEGDFNIVVNDREIIGFGRNYRRFKMRDFADFIFNTNLIDVQCKGNLFLGIVDTADQ